MIPTREDQEDEYDEGEEQDPFESERNSSNRSEPNMLGKDTNTGSRTGSSEKHIYPQQHHGQIFLKKPIIRKTLPQIRLPTSSLFSSINGT